MSNTKPKDCKSLIASLVQKHRGFTALGREFGVHGWAVQKWYRSNNVPAERVPMLLDLAKLHGIDVKPWQIRPDIYPPKLFATQFGPARAGIDPD